MLISTYATVTFIVIILKKFVYLILIDWLKSKPTEYFKRIELAGGGKVISISDYLKQKEKPKIKELDLAGMFTPNKTLSSLSEAEREAVNNLLKLTLGKD